MQIFERKDGLHSPEEPRGSLSLQIRWSGPLLNFEIRSEAFLQQCCHQMLPNVYGVSATILEDSKTRRECAKVYRPNAVGTS